LKLSLLIHNNDSPYRTIVKSV